MALPPHVDRDDLMSTLREELANLPGAPSTEPDAFWDVIMHWLIQWRLQYQAKDLANSQPTAFLLEPENYVRNDKWTLAPLFREALAENLVDNAALFLTSASMHQVFRTTVKQADVESLYMTIMRLGLGMQPCLIYIPSHGAVIWCPNGVAGDRKKRFTMLFDQFETIDQAAIDKALEDFHKDYTSFPDGWANIWHNANQGIVEKKTENTIRNWLCHYLKFRIFKSSHVAREYQLTSGRADIWIGGLNTTPVSTYILELKVLRSRHFPGKSTKARSISDTATLRYAKSGVRQAARYKASDGAQLAYLCCYDARDTNVTLIDVASDAATNGILYRQYYCERTSKAA